jgi:hypothetical protein
MVQEYPGSKARDLRRASGNHSVNCSLLLLGTCCAGDSTGTGGGRQHSLTTAHCYNSNFCQPNPNVTADSDPYANCDRSFSNPTTIGYVRTDTHSIFSNQRSICDINPATNRYPNPYRDPSAANRDSDPNWHPSTDRYANVNAHQYGYLTSNCDCHQPTDRNTNQYRNCSTADCDVQRYPNEYSNRGSHRDANCN